MQNFARQLVMQSGTLCLYLKCGTSDQIKKGGKCEGEHNLRVRANAKENTT